MPEVLIFFNRDAAGRKATDEAVERLAALGVAAAFDWEQQFSGTRRTAVAIPETIADPCDFTAAPLQWFRRKEAL